jgi:hypothetical protein
VLFRRRGPIGSGEVSGAFAAWSFRIALRSEPVYAARPLEPLIDFGFALETLDVANLGPRKVRLNLPIALGDPLHFENDARFCHRAEYEPFSPGRKPFIGRRLKPGSSIVAAACKAGTEVIPAT